MVTNFFEEGISIFFQYKKYVEYFKQNDILVFFCTARLTKGLKTKERTNDLSDPIWRRLFL